MRHLAVKLNERLTGTLTVLTDQDRSIFRFDQGYLDDPYRPVLGQFFEDRRPQSVDHSGLINWFMNLCPQGALARLIEREFDIDEPIDMLEALGADLPGAVVLERLPADAVAAVRGEPEDVPIPRFSLAGVQRKMSVRKHKGGYVLPVSGTGGDYIVKLESPDFEDLPRREYLATEWAKRAGLRVVDATLEASDRFPLATELFEDPRPGKLFVSRRFDRSAERRIHFEDFAQVLNRAPSGRGLYDFSFEGVAQAIAILLPDERNEWLGRLVFMVDSGNFDAHLKNWAIMYPDDRTPALTPAYDLVPVALYPETEVEHELALSLGGSKDDKYFGPERWHDLFAALQWDSANGWRSILKWRKLIRGALQSPDIRSLATRDELTTLQRRCQLGWA